MRFQLWSAVGSHRCSDGLIRSVLGLLGFLAHGHIALADTYSMDIAPDVSIHFEELAFDEKAVSECESMACNASTCPNEGSGFYGSDGKPPKSRLSKMAVTVKAHTYNLEVAGMFDTGLTQENLKERIKVIALEDGNYKVMGRFSDGAGAYLAQWTVGQSKAFRNFLGQAEDLYEMQSWLERAD